MKSGFFCINKPEGITSHSVVSRMRKILNMKKVGHSGTLDPMATGVMVVGFGTSTRLLDYVQSGTKEYVAKISFGEKTNTADRQGTIIQSVDMGSLTRDQLINAVNKFIGAIEQVPPMVSAIKIDGKKLYEYEREGIQVERKSRKVTIHEIEVIEYNCAAQGLKPTAVLRIVCSSGTYIRTLGEDIARELGGLAHLVELRRTKNGNIHEKDCIDLEELAGLSNPFVEAKNPLDVLGHINKVEITSEQAMNVSQGKKLELAQDQLAKLEQPSRNNTEVFAVYSKLNPRLVAIYPLNNLADLKSRCVVFLD